jgi:hypothetical protein
MLLPRERGITCKGVFRAVLRDWNCCLASMGLKPHWNHMVAFIERRDLFNNLQSNSKGKPTNTEHVDSRDL